MNTNLTISVDTEHLRQDLKRLADAAHGLAMNVDISTIKLWFERAVPNPTDKNRAVQIGCHIEEFAEMGDAISDVDLSVRTNVVADFYKLACEGIANQNVDRKELLDSLCDQIVTAIGVAHMFGLDISGALSEVNRSNFSKFLDGQPVFDENGKITKGPNYTPPNLGPYL